MAENWHLLTFIEHLKHHQFFQNLTNGLGADTMSQTDRQTDKWMDKTFDEFVQGPQI
jgi:hypothetical protein